MQFFSCIAHLHSCMTFFLLKLFQAQHAFHINVVHFKCPPCSAEVFPRKLKFTNSGISPQASLTQEKPLFGPMCMCLCLRWQLIERYVQKRQEAFNDTRPSCGRFRVRFTLTPTGLTDPQSWKWIFKCSPFELHPSWAPAAADRWLEGLDGLWDGVRERERQWELQGVVTKAKLQKRVFV